MSARTAMRMAELGTAVKWALRTALSVMGTVWRHRASQLTALYRHPRSKTVLDTSRGETRDFP